MLLAVAVVALILIFASEAQALTAFGPKVQAIAEAIAHAEGFGVAGALPTRAHNPGDLKLGDIGFGAINGKTVFSSDNDGWNALRKQIQLMISGESSYYQPTDTWRAIANTWVGTSDYVNWMNTVTGDLGVDPDSTLGDYVAS